MMEIRDILSVGLTAEDFETMIKGIDAIPEVSILKEDISDLMTTMLAIAINKTQGDIQIKKLEAKRKAAVNRVDSKNEDLIIVKSKLILLKRLLLSNDALRQAEEILTPPPPPHTHS